MKQIPVITDLHMGARGDSSVVYEIQERFFRDVFWPALDAHGGVDEMLLLGDVSDRRKFCSYAMLDFAKRVFFDPAAERDIRIHWTLGNHDLPMKNSTNLSSHIAFQEYLNVILYRTATVVEFDGVETLMMPWLCEENRAASQATFDSFTGAVIAGHLEFLGFEMYRGIVSQEGVSTAAFAPFKLVMSGHFHHRSTTGNIHYLGAPYEMTWSDHDDLRGFHWWTPQEHRLDPVNNPHALFYEFIYNDDGQPADYVKNLLSIIRQANVSQKIVKIVIRRKTQPLWFETFMDAVLKIGAYDIQFVDETAWSTDDTQAPSEGEGEDPATMDTLTMIYRYVAGLPWANTDIQRDVTKTLAELYQEAADTAKNIGRG